VIFICFSILFVVEVEMVRHEEIVASSRYVFLKHTVSSRAMERPVWAGDAHREAFLAMRRVQWNVLQRWRFICCTFINISV
jgi:hypothetical protein